MEKLTEKVLLDGDTEFVTELTLHTEGRSSVFNMRLGEGEKAYGARSEIAIAGLVGGDATLVNGIDRIIDALTKLRKQVKVVESVTVTPNS